MKIFSSKATDNSEILTIRRRIIISSKCFEKSEKKTWPILIRYFHKDSLDELEQSLDGLTMRFLMIEQFCDFFCEKIPAHFENIQRGLPIVISSQNRGRFTVIHFTKISQMFRNNFTVDFPPKLWFFDVKTKTSFWFSNNKSIQTFFKFSRIPTHFLKVSSLRDTLEGYYQMPEFVDSFFD